MPALLVSHKRPGFYCRVIEEGDIGTGDAIVKLSGGEGEMSIAEVDGLLYSNKHPADRLLKTLSVKALSKGWHDSLQALYDSVATGGTSGNPGLAPVRFAWEGFLPFLVSKITVESEDVRSFELIAADGRPLPRFVPGEHIVVRIPGPSRPLIRMYSLCGPPNPDYYRIAVKAEPNGLAGNYLHQVLQPGQTLEISAPRGGFTLADGQSPLVLIGAGIGITPLLAMLYAVDKGREVHWIYTSQNAAHYPFQAEVRRVSANLARYRSQIFFTRPAAGETSGRLTPDVLKQLRLPADGDYYLCGPQGFMSAVTTTLAILGIPATSIKQEAFGNATQTGAGAGGDQTVIAGKQPHLPTGAEGAGPLVTFAKTGLSFPWSDRFASLLEAAEACDVPVSWSCRVGVCHRCETTLFTGETSYTTPPLDPPGGGNILLCCSIPRSDCQLDL
jgi:ferredoxin-NADP reductase